MYIFYNYLLNIFLNITVGCADILTGLRFYEEDVILCLTAALSWFFTIHSLLNHFLSKLVTLLAIPCEKITKN